MFITCREYIFIYYFYYGIFSQSLSSCTDFRCLSS